MSGQEIILFFANPNSEFGFAKNKPFVASSMVQAFSLIKLPIFHDLCALLAFFDSGVNVSQTIKFTWIIV